SCCAPLSSFPSVAAPPRLLAQPSQAAALQASAARSIAIGVLGLRSILSARSTAAAPAPEPGSAARPPLPLSRSALRTASRPAGAASSFASRAQPPPLQFLAAMPLAFCDSPSAACRQLITASCRLCRLPLIWPPLIPSFDLAATDTACHHVRARGGSKRFEAASGGTDRQPEKLRNSETRWRQPGSPVDRQTQSRVGLSSRLGKAQLTSCPRRRRPAVRPGWTATRPTSWKTTSIGVAAADCLMAGCDGGSQRPRRRPLGTVQLAPRSPVLQRGQRPPLLGQRSHRIRKASSELHADEGSIAARRRRCRVGHALPALTEEAATAPQLLMELDSGRLRRRIVRACRLLLAADRCALFLAEPGGWLRLTADTVAAEARALQSPEVRVPPGRRHRCNAAATGQTLRLEELRRTGLVDAASRAFQKSARIEAAAPFKRCSRRAALCANVRALAAPLKHRTAAASACCWPRRGAARPPSPKKTPLTEKSLQTFLALLQRQPSNSELFPAVPAGNEEKRGSFDEYSKLLADEADGTDNERRLGADRLLLISSEIAQSVLSSGEPLYSPPADPTPGSREASASGRCSACPSRNALFRAVGLCLLMNPADGQGVQRVGTPTLAEASALFCASASTPRRRQAAGARRVTAQKAAAGGGCLAAGATTTRPRAGGGLRGWPAAWLPSRPGISASDQLAFDRVQVGKCCSVPKATPCCARSSLSRRAGLLAVSSADYRGALPLAALAPGRLRTSGGRLGIRWPSLYSSSRDGERRHFSRCIMLLSLELRTSWRGTAARLIPQRLYTALVEAVHPVATTVRQHLSPGRGCSGKAQTGRVDWSSKAEQRDHAAGACMTCLDHRHDIQALCKALPASGAGELRNWAKVEEQRGPVEKREGSKATTIRPPIAEQHVAFHQMLTLLCGNAGDSSGLEELLWSAGPRPYLAAEVAPWHPAMKAARQVDNAR
uniref:HECT domain-containing protein n=1 Tax=Macrostomum lignano TaxID=282301 RepID=A0A1I8F877_9PLAT